MTDIVSATDLRRRYGEGEAAVDALDGVTVGFPHVAFTAIMGASGSGKSTMMNVIGCLDRPTSGEYLLDGLPIASWTPGVSVGEHVTAWSDLLCTLAGLPPLAPGVLQLPRRRSRER